MKKDLLKLTELSREEIFTILDLADQLKYDVKNGIPHRHLEGKVVILFLRSAEDPDTPLCTIEMNGMRIVQIHGYKNDLESGAVPPEERFADFLSVWLPWVEAHSPRDAQGRPILPEQVRCEIA